jgi:hypothetical protein
MVGELQDGCLRDWSRVDVPPMLITPLEARCRGLVEPVLGVSAPLCEHGSGGDRAIVDPSEALADR